MTSDDNGSADKKRTHKKKRFRKQGIEVKLYLVFKRVNVASTIQPHEELFISAEMTRKAAEEVAKQHIGSYIFKVSSKKNT